MGDFCLFRKTLYFLYLIIYIKYNLKYFAMNHLTLSNHADQLEGEVTILRLDLNVPMKNGESQDPARADAVVDTIRQTLDAGAERIFLISHRSKQDDGETLEPVAAYLEEKLGEAIEFRDTLTAGEGGPKIVMFDDIRRLESREKSKDSAERQEAAQRILEVTGATRVVVDAFGAAHRPHTTMKDLPALAEKSMIGDLMEAEVARLEQFRDPEMLAKATVFMGGAKIDDKLGLMIFFAENVKKLVPGGGILNAILAAKGYDVGESLGHDGADKAQEVIAAAEKSGCEIVLPSVMFAAKFESPEAVGQLTQSDIFRVDLSESDAKPPEGTVYLDMGATEVHEAMTDAEVIIWNGTAGVGDLNSEFDYGTKAGLIGAYAAEQAEVPVLIAGGDGNAAATRLSIEIKGRSTGGGAALAYLEKGEAGLPVLVSGVTKAAVNEVIEV